MVIFFVAVKKARYVNIPGQYLKRFTLFYEYTLEACIPKNSQRACKSFWVPPNNKP